VSVNGGLAQYERLDFIRSGLQRDGAVRIDELARELTVSEMTIRRDLDELQALGVARRVRGGAVAVGPEAFAERHRRRAREKGTIAEKLLPLLPASGSVAFDASTTVHRLAAAITGARDLQVLTNGLDTFQLLADRPGVTAILTGGSIEPRTGSLVGPVARRAADAFIFELFICSASALDPALGSSEASQEEAEMKRAVATTSRRIVLAVDHSKLGTLAPARVFSLDQLDLLVTDLDPGDARLAPYRDRCELL
jgi:DeoR family transcriptional regulator, fructose operon transcriptional repressor